MMDSVILRGVAMTPIRYTANVLADGHLPLPKDVPFKAGDPDEVTLVAVGDGKDAEVPDHAGYLIKHWAGIGRGSGEPVAERHDDHLYGG
jgi:hypothetical protein